MTKSSAQTDSWGIQNRFQDGSGRWQRVPDKTRSALIAAMDQAPSSDEPSQPPQVRVIREGTGMKIPSGAHLTLEDGRQLRVKRELPSDLPLGYHWLTPAGKRHPQRLIVCPQRCYLPENLNAWGWVVQLYALRSESSWGIGDLRDLRRFARWARETLHAGFLMINPLHAVLPFSPQEPSPYYPGSRRFLNPLYLCLEEILEAVELRPRMEHWRQLGRELNRMARIDRDEIFRLKMTGLQQLWQQFGGDPDFDRFCHQQGEELRRFALFSALAEHFGSGWTTWPAAYRHPEAAAVKRFARDRFDRLRFHQWLQWQLRTQLNLASQELLLIQDLPIGVNPRGADAWAWQDLLAHDVSVGAPPDEFNTQGQNWGLPPLIPHRLRAAAYEPFRQTIQANLQPDGGLRIDHAMGLFRLYWIPNQFPPGQGAYVRYPAEDLLAILALESQRAKAVVIGEDLGTVEPEMREALAAHDILSYRVLWFENHPPARYPPKALASVTTHDLPTIAGLWTGHDLEVQQKLNLQPNVKGFQRTRQKLARLTGLPLSAPVSQVIRRTHETLAHAPSTLLAATLEDALAVEERPNYPGTTRHWPNWSIPLPYTLEQIQQQRLVHSVARAFGRRQE